jgi:tetratricopeptide (TPR) repeat protein
MNKLQSWLIVAGITIFGVLWRLYLFSGDGLGDDSNFFSAYYRIFVSGDWQPLAYNYRIGLWLPILLLWKLFGVSELTWILAITLSSVLCIPLTYLLGRYLFSERGGQIAAILLAVHPFDVLTSTLFVNDIPFSLYAGLAMLFFLLGIRTENRESHINFILSAFFIWWSYMTKMWGLFTIPIFAAYSLIHYRKWKGMLIFYLSLISFFILSFLLDYCLTGDFFGYYHAELRIAGLWEVTKDTLLEYPRLMFLPNWYGKLFHGIYCWLTVPALIAAAFHWRKTYFPALWLMLIFLTMEFMPQKVDFNAWYSQARIFRYLSVIVIPSCLILAFSAEAILRRRQNIGIGILLIFIATALLQGYSLTLPSRDAYDDVRNAVRKVLTFPEKPIYSDYMMMSHLERFHFGYERSERVRSTREENIGKREIEFLKIRNAYVITGGARNPYYGCNHCIANIGDFGVPDHWELLWISDKPSAPWRKEPLRIWEVGESADSEQKISQYEKIHKLYEIGKQQFSEGNYTQAHELLGKLLGTAIQSNVKPQALWYYGITLMRLNDPKSALKEFNKWLIRYHGHELESEVYYHIGVCYRDTGQIKKAVNAFEYVLEKFPNSSASIGSRDVLGEIGTALK